MSDVQPVKNSAETPKNQEAPTGNFQFQFQGQFPQGYKWAIDKSDRTAQPRAQKYQDAELKYAPIYQEIMSLLSRRVVETHTAGSELRQRASILTIASDRLQRAEDLINHCQTLTLQAFNAALSASERAFLDVEWQVLKDEIHDILSQSVHGELKDQTDASLPNLMIFNIGHKSSETVQVTFGPDRPDFSDISILTIQSTKIAGEQLKVALSLLSTRKAIISSELRSIESQLKVIDTAYNPAQRIYDILNQYS